MRSARRRSGWRKRRRKTFIGHVAVGFAAKRAAPRTSLGLLVGAPLLADLLWPIFLLLWLLPIWAAWFDRHRDPIPPARATP